ncbi:MAG: SPFH domain-containing protein [Muribaculaceae bacterium]
MNKSTNEYNYKGVSLNGILMLIVILLVMAGSVALIAKSSDTSDDIIYVSFWAVLIAAVAFVMALISLAGFVKLEPNEVAAMLFFGKYRGTLRKNGYFWVNPFMTKKKMTLRARNLDGKPIKVNDKDGNPILIGLVVVWRLKDTYKALFDVDLQENASTQNVNSRMNALEKFVSIQSDAALRQVAGQYAYDNNEGGKADGDAITLRSGGNEINEQLEGCLNERLSMAGIEVVEARINNLNYAPEIAAVMLRRQQASAVVSAREKIVEGAVSMVKLALDRLQEEKIELDDEKRAAMVSNLLVVLCGDESATPVINTGTLNH